MAMRNAKEELAKPDPQGREIRENARAAQQAINQWLAMVPEADVRRAFELFKNVRAADVDGNGKLSEAELGTLNQSDRDAWKDRVALVGE